MYVVMPNTSDYLFIDFAMSVAAAAAADRLTANVVNQIIYFGLIFCCGGHRPRTSLTDRPNCVLNVEPGRCEVEQLLLTLSFLAGNCELHP